MKLIAMQEFLYAGQPLKPGDKFEAEDEHARILKGLGKARDFAEIETRQMKSDEATSNDSLFQENAGRRGGKTGGRYNRTDMRPKD